MDEHAKQSIAAVFGVMLGVGFVVFCPDVGLGEQGVRCLGILLGAIVWWAAGMLPEYATGLLAVLPAATQERFDLLTWFVAALPWLVVATVLTWLCIQAMYRPRANEASASTVSASGTAADAAGGGALLRDLPRLLPRRARRKHPILAVDGPTLDA